MTLMGTTSGLRIEIANDRRAFSPRDTIAGRVSWSVAGVESAELRLFWYTRGKGTQDVSVIETLPFANPQNDDRREFRFTLPGEPFSFSGQLVSLVWALELILEPGTHVERQDIVVAPNGKEIVLNREGA